MVSVGETANNSIWGCFFVAAARYDGILWGFAPTFIGT
ncbi:hypothetical protein yfred0001_30380 [Yersinia frederiksenii ATCC 33641]|nr:hypothetical protein yfred0001_30380 [Yersinia frederiksenii ATCC 33641]